MRSDFESAKEKLGRYAQISKRPLHTPPRMAPPNDGLGTTELLFYSPLIILSIILVGGDFGNIWTKIAGYALGVLVLLFFARVLRRMFQETKEFGPIPDPQPCVILENGQQTARHIVALLTVSGERAELMPVSVLAHEVEPGDLGWAYIREPYLVDFVPARRDELERLGVR